MHAGSPALNEAALARDEVEMVVQINGKVRERVTVSTAASREDVEAMVLDLESVQRHIDGKQIRKVIVVPGKLVNIAVS